MQFTGQQCALLGRSGLTLQRRGTQALQGAGQMAGQCVEQLHLFR